MSVYLPDLMIVGNVQGGALISDGYLVAEWRVDPWKGFDLPEGFWRRTKGHQFEPRDQGGKRTAAQVLRSIMPARRNRPSYKWDATKQVQVEQRATEDVKGYRGDERTPMVPFVSSTVTTHVAPDLLGHLVRIIGGEPTRWTTMSSTAPLDAWDGTHWLGAVMPMLTAHNHPSRRGS